MLRNLLINSIKYSLTLLLVAISNICLNAQEFDIKVSVSQSNTSMLSDAQIFRNLEQTISEFLNRTKWTNDDYAPHEKIKGSIQVIVKEEPSLNNYVADITIKTARPVFKTMYDTDMFSFTDANFSFSFNVGQVLQKSDNIFYDNLSSTFTFYAYIMLGLDYDSFSLYGGEDYYIMAREVRSALPASMQNNDPSWSSGLTVTRNKYWIVNDFLDTRVRPVRAFSYDYHRKIMDNMYMDPDKQRAILVSNISALDQVFQSYPNCLALQIFADAKRSELVEIFKVADGNQKTRIHDLLMKINPSQSKYFEILKQ